MQSSKYEGALVDVDMSTDRDNDIQRGGSDSNDDDTDIECEEVSSDEDIDQSNKADEVILHLENLALSFLSQLTASLKPPKTNQDFGSGTSSQQTVPSAPRRIVLELANRGKAHTSGGATKMRSVVFPKKSRGPSARAPAQVLRIANAAHEALLDQSPMTKRDIFYRDVALFKNQTMVDTLVDDLAATFSINRSDLSIRASSKGLYCGSALTIHLHDGTRLVGHDTEASLIPAAQDINELEIQEDIAWILVVEKDAVFQTLRNAGLTSHPSLPGHGILITGKGYPDLATRQLVKTFSENMPEKTRILVLVDADAYGLDIISVYKYGSASMEHEKESLAAERVEWIGVSATEALKLGVDRDMLLPITIHDQRKAFALLRSANRLPAAWKRELMQMLHTRRKAEIEILTSLPSSSSFDESDVDEEDYLSHCSVARLPNPLVRYLIWKIDNALAAY